MKSALIFAGGFYVDDAGVTFQAGEIYELDGRKYVPWAVVRVEKRSRSYHRVGGEGEWPLATFAARVRKSWTRRCRLCRCTDARACDAGCSWAEIDLCTECTPEAIAEREGLAS